MSLVLEYVVIAGTVTAGAQIARGAVQAIHKVAEGKHAEGLWKFAGGLVAPIIGAGQQLLGLGAEALAAAKSLRTRINGKIGRTQISN